MSLRSVTFSFLLTTLLIDTVHAVEERNSCNGVQCRSTISMPLIDGMKATLKADLDVTDLNEAINLYIQKEVEARIAVVLNRTLESSVNTKMEEAISNIQDSIKGHKKYAFFATLISEKNDLSSGTVVIFDKVDLDEGNAYDGSTGKFTCLEDGLYHFSWTTVSREKKDFTSNLVVNGRIIAANVVDSDSVSDSMSGTVNIIVKMVTGEKAWIAVQGSEGKNLRDDWNNYPCSMFSGFKI